MQTKTFSIRELPKEASDADYTAMNDFMNAMRHERTPDDPDMPVDEQIRNLKSLPPFVDLHLWLAYAPGGEEVAGVANTIIMRTDDNPQLVQFELSVLPAFRRQGMGRELMRLVAQTARQERRGLLMTNTNDRVPGGEAFMKRLGAKKGLEAHTNQLSLAELDRDLVAGWLESSRLELPGFALGLWDGPYPEAHLDEIARLFDLVNQQPLGELEIEDMHMTPEQLRQMEANLFARGSQRWTFYITDRSTGKFAGYSETVWNPNRPQLVRQDMTGVFPEYRGRGLGRWLKAAMLDKILRERPEARFVRTGNADSNAAMLSINTALGFKPYMAEALWQVELEKVEAYLG